MGDRINVVLYYDEEEEQKVVFYSHWGGHGMLECIAKALERGRSRWDDMGYLARIIFSEMIKDEVMETTGYGIFPTIGDDINHENIFINLHSETVSQGTLTWSYNNFMESIRSGTRG